MVITSDTILLSLLLLFTFIRIVCTCLSAAILSCSIFNAINSRGSLAGIDATPDPATDLDPDPDPATDPATDLDPVADPDPDPAADADADDWACLAALASLANLLCLVFIASCAL